MKTFGLIGKVLGYSFSKQFFTEKFQREKLHNHEYVNFELEDINQFDALFANYPTLAGLNVTIPYKQEIISKLDGIDAVAAAVGAVNTIKVGPGTHKPALKGYNTDVVGFEQSLVPFLKSHHTKALILGTGGASKAVQFVLNKLNIPSLLVSRQANASSNYISYNQLSSEVLKTHTLIVNTTPLGTHPNVAECPHINFEHIGAKHLLYDLIYNPEETLFLQQGRLHGAATVNGLHMLKLQADAAWDIWNS